MGAGGYHHSRLLFLQVEIRGLKTPDHSHQNLEIRRVKTVEYRRSAAHPSFAEKDPKLIDEFLVAQAFTGFCAGPGAFVLSLEHALGQFLSERSPQQLF